MSRNQISIQVATQYLPEQSDSAHNHYMFAYTIVIKNGGVVPAKLLSRHWIITDANGHVQEVRGIGVVGEQPYLKSGESYQYTSSVIIATPVGSMQGSYHMVSDENEHFTTEIAAFSLAVPNTLN